MKVEVGEEYIHGIRDMYASFGNYYEYNNYFALAVSNTTMNVTHLDVKYNKLYGLFELYPRGQIQCGCCKKEKIINIENPAYVMYFPKRRLLETEKMVYNYLLCKDCKERAGKHAYLVGIICKELNIFGGAPDISRADAKSIENKFILRCLARRWRKKARQLAIVRKM